MAHEGEPNAQLWAMADLVTPMAIRVAATLRLADHIAAGARATPDLAAATGVDADILERLLRHLAAKGILSRDDDGEYALSTHGFRLRDDHPRGIRARLDLDGAVGRADLSFVQLLHTVRTGEPAFPAQFGRSFWDDLATDPERQASFDSQMGTDVAAWAPAVIAAYDWGRVGHLVDVGGGNGSLMIAVLTEYPTLRGTVLDLPATTATAQTALEAAGLADRAQAVSGSFFDLLPPDAPGYLLTAVIHDWDDDAARAILQRCREAAGAQGTVFIVEKIGVDGASPDTEMDLRLLAYFGGRERSLTELTALSEQAGFHVAAVHPAGAISILESGPVDSRHGWCRSGLGPGATVLDPAPLGPERIAAATTLTSDRALSSAVERCLHTAEVTGSKPVAPTKA